jgi:hypothetical protein
MAKSLSSSRSMSVIGLPQQFQGFVKAVAPVDMRIDRRMVVQIFAIAKAPLPPPLVTTLSS